MMDTIERPCTDEITEPAKQWRNWYCVVVTYHSKTDMRQRVVGEKLQHPSVWPSRDIAEQKAREMTPTSPETAFAKGYLEWIGAYPEGVAP